MIVGIEHFGSTAVPGLSAKPVIDLLVAVRSLAEARERGGTHALEAIGYSYWRDDPAPDRMFLVKGLPPNGPRTHHVHIVELGMSRTTRAWESSLLWTGCCSGTILRDATRRSAGRYAALKQDLADRFPDDREAYTEGKTDYVYGVMQKARMREE